MKKAYIYAYDRQNLGDDLFVHTLVKRYPRTKFYMWSDVKNRETFASLKSLKVFDRDSRFVHFLRRLRPSLVARYRSIIEGRCDAVVYIGGSIFMEYPNWQQICTWWEWTSKNRPFFVLGANFGPYHTEAYRDTMAEIFANCRDVCFRDRYSAKLFGDTVRMAPDILFSYPMPHVSVKDEQVFVSVINCAGRDESHGLDIHDERYVSNMAALLRTLLNEGKRIVLASFCKEEGDEDGIAKIVSSLGCENDPMVKTLYYDGTNAHELTRTIAESGGVIATRFHAVILALAAGRPVLPIIYSDKTKHVLCDLGFSGTVYDLRDDTPWTECAMSRCDVPYADAERHFARLDEILK